MKVVINKCFGGFSISPEAALWLFERGFDEEGFKTPVEEYWKDNTRYGPDSLLGKDNNLAAWRKYLQTGRSGRPSLFITVFTPDEKFVLSTRPDKRDAPLLVECVETLGEKANGGCASLEVIEIPDGVNWVIDEYDGMESIHEEHRSWG